MILISSIFLAASTFLAFNAQEKSVSLTLEALGAPEKQEIEFFIVGPGSENDYEAMFMTKVGVKEIADAFRKAGFPVGKYFDPSKCRFYPSGARVEITPKLSEFLSGFDRSESDIIFTGGSLERDGSPVAATNMPLAVFALYNLPQSLLQYNEYLDQSATYGRFRPIKKLKKGDRFVFRFKLVENSLESEYAAAFKSVDDVKRIFTEIKHLAEKSSAVNVSTDFDPQLTVSQAHTVAKALETIDSAKVRMDSFRPEQFYYKAFLPRDEWRDRKKRVQQPVEIHIGENPSADRLVIVFEDWSNEKSLDPKLTTKNFSIDETDKITNQNTCLIFAKGNTKLSRLYELKKKFKSICNWYIYL